MSLLTPPPDLLEALVEAPHRANGWNEALEHARGYIGCSQLTVVIRDGRAEGLPVVRTLSAGVPAATEEAYRLHYGAHDPLAPHVHRSRPGQILIADRIVAPEERKVSAFYNEWAIPHDVPHAMASKVVEVAGLSVLAVCTRDHRSGAFTGPEARAFAALFPYFRNALTIEAHLPSTVRPALAQTAIEAFDEAVFVLERGGTVVGLNSNAQNLLGSGLYLRLENERLVPVQHGEGPRFARWLSSQTDAASSPYFIFAGEADSPRLRLMATWLPRRGTDGPALFLFARFLGAPTILPEHQLSEIFGFTAAEASVARALVRGESIEAIAATTGISAGTVRNHLKRIFSKTGVHRQTELAALVLGLLPSAAPRPLP